jgi:GxxExxY protein
MIYQDIDPELNLLSNEVIGLAIKVHRFLGPGLLEAVYRECLFYEILKAGMSAEKEKPLSVIYDSIKIDIGYRLDILVENQLVLELKSTSILTEVHTAQLLTYLKLTGNRLGLLINFNVPLLKNGIKRYVL